VCAGFPVSVFAFVRISVPRNSLRCAHHDRH
jgi:hypothetical protein